MIPAASIVIPAYNAVAFLGDAISSAQQQTLREIEIIIVDDASTDATWEVIQAAAGRDPRIRPLRRSRRGGPSAACNSGFGQATGRWIALLDADDLFLPERLERLIRHAETMQADLIADNLLQRDFATGADLGPHLRAPWIFDPEPLSLLEMLRRDRPDAGPHEKLGYVQPIKRREFLAGSGVRFAEDVGAGEDFLHYFECVAKGARFHLVPEAHYVYRVRRGSVSNGRPVAHHFSAANRRMYDIAARIGARDVMAVLRQRQLMLDYSSFEEAVQAGNYAAALRFAHPWPLSHALSQLRILLRHAESRRGKPAPAR